VIVRSSVNLNAGAESKLSAIFHGILLAVCAVFLPTYLNLIPLSCLAAILLVTGCKLASVSLVREMWAQGRYQFIPFAVTVAAIVLTDLLVGIVIGLLISVGFILNSNLRRPIRRVVEKHLGGEVFHIELADQVSFLNRAALSKLLDTVPRGTHLLLDAQSTDYIDPDVLSIIRGYRDHTAPARGVEVSLVGFRSKYQLDDQIQYVDYSTRELQESVSPQQVLQILMDGNQRFRNGRLLTRHFSRQVQKTAMGQHPLAVVLSCIDSRAPAEIIFDAGLGDIFSVRIAGNTTSQKVLGSIEYCCVVAGAKLILVMGHTRCGAVTAAVQLACSDKSAAQATGCHHAQFILDDIQHSIDPHVCRRLNELSPADRDAFVNEVATRNVVRSVAQITEQSPEISRLIADGRLALVGAMYDVSTGCVRIL
jgi:carbonic anhydrase/SulP family sulfate permease